MDHFDYDRGVDPNEMGRTKTPWIIKSKNILFVQKAQTPAMLGFA